MFFASTKFSWTSAFFFKMGVLVDKNSYRISTKNCLRMDWKIWEVLLLLYWRRGIVWKGGLIPLTHCVLIDGDEESAGLIGYDVKKIMAIYPRPHHHPILRLTNCHHYPYHILLCCFGWSLRYRLTYVIRDIRRIQLFKRHDGSKFRFPLPLPHYLKIWCY